MTTRLYSETSKVIIKVPLCIMGILHAVRIWSGVMWPEPQWYDLWWRRTAFSCLKFIELSVLIMVSANERLIQEVLNSTVVSTVEIEDLYYTQQTKWVKCYLKVFFQGNALENVVWKMTTFLSRPQYVRVVVFISLFNLRLQYLRVWSVFK